MRTTEERLNSILINTEKKKAKYLRRKMLIARCVIFSACVVLICLVGCNLSLPIKSFENANDNGLFFASIFRNNHKIELIIIGVTAFVLGIFAEILLNILNKKNKKHGGK